MRLVIGLCAVALSAAVARADEPNVSQSPSSAAVQARVPLRVVTMLPETNQALLFDVHQGTHVLVGVGATIAGYRVEGITRDAVILSAPGAHLVLTSDRGGRAPHAAGPAGPATSAPPVPLQPAGTPRAPEDPYAATAIVDTSRSFTAGQGGVRVVEAPDAAPDAQPVPSVTLDASVPAAAAPVRDLPVPVTDSGTLGAPDAASPPPALDASAPAAVPPVETVPPPPVLDATVTTSPTPAPPAVPSPAPSLADEFATAMTGVPPTAQAPSPPPATAPPAAAPPATSPPATSPASPVTIRRAALTAALADFDQLGTMLRAKLIPAGARLELVAPTSVFGQAGLATGDVVTVVNGLPLRTLDDAAELYARASTAAGATIQVLRGGQPVTLRVQIE